MTKYSAVLYRDGKPFSLHRIGLSLTPEAEPTAVASIAAFRYRMEDVLAHRGIPEKGLFVLVAYDNDVSAYAQQFGIELTEHVLGGLHVMVHKTLTEFYANVHYDPRRSAFRLIRSPDKDEMLESIMQLALANAEQDMVSFVERVLTTAVEVKKGPHTLVIQKHRPSGSYTVAYKDGTEKLKNPEFFRDPAIATHALFKRKNSDDPSAYSLLGVFSPFEIMER